MGGPLFDRQVFVKKKEPQKPPSRSPLPGGLVLLIVAALSAFATYRYVQAGGKEPTDSADKAQIAELQGKLKEMQARVKQLEGRRRRDPVSHAAATAGTSKSAKPMTTSHELLAEDAPHPALTAASVLKHPTAAKTTNLHHADRSKTPSAAPHKTVAAAVEQPASHAPNRLASNQPAVPSKELNALQGNLEATRQEWKATANRMGSVVGELDSQRAALQKTQSGVNYLLQRVQRDNVPFTLSKGSRLQRVGPISMELESDSVNGQHYTIRMIVDDKSVVLKDRALNEIVQFYTSQSKYPLRLIVSQIGRKQVSGTLAVPTSMNQQESSSPQLQQR